MSESPNPPYLVLYTESKRVVDGEERTFRNRAGVAFPFKNGTGFNVHVDTNLLVMNQAALLPPIRERATTAPPSRQPRPASGRPGPRPAAKSRTPAFRDDVDDPFDDESIPF